MGESPLNPESLAKSRRLPVSERGSSVNTQEFSTHRRDVFLPLALLTLLLAMAGLPAAAQAPSAESDKTAEVLHQMNSSFQSLVKRVSPAVVEVLVTGFGSPDEEEDDLRAQFHRPRTQPRLRCHRRSRRLHHHQLSRGERRGSCARSSDSGANPGLPTHFPAQVARPRSARAHRRLQQAD